MYSRFCLHILNNLEINSLTKNSIDFLIERVLKQELSFQTQNLLLDLPSIKEIDTQNHSDSDFYINQLLVNKYKKLILIGSVNNNLKYTDLDNNFMLNTNLYITESDLLINIFKYIETNNIEILKSAIKVIVEHNHKNPAPIIKESLLYPPYYSSEYITKYIMGLSENKRFKLSGAEISGYSYYLFHLLALFIDKTDIKDLNEFLETPNFLGKIKMWGLISDIGMKLYVTNDTNELFKINAMDSKGYTKVINFDSDIVSDSDILSEYTGEYIPKVLTQYKFLIPYYLYIFPYRFNYQIVKYIL